MRLSLAMGDLAKGDPMALNRFLEISADVELAPGIAELAENISLLLVLLEALEFHLENIVEEEKRLQILNDLKNTYMGVASHDIRPTLTAINGLAGTMLKGGLSDEK